MNQVRARRDDLERLKKYLLREYLHLSVNSHVVCENEPYRNKRDKELSTLI